jgi:predicted dehydrogenase
MERLRIGVIGCGMISEKYLENLTKTFAFCLDVRAVADIVPEAAQKRAEQFGVPVACSPDELFGPGDRAGGQPDDPGGPL